MQIASRILVISIALIAGATVARAQLLKRVSDNVKQRAEDRVVNRSGDAADKTMDAIEEDMKGNGKEKGKKKETQQPVGDAEDTVEEIAGTKPSTPNKSAGAGMQAFSNYDFVPGDRIIYQYDMAGERDAEIPGRMLINDGTVEVQTYQNEKVLYISHGANVSMKPLMKHDGYLPEQFTLEFDVLANGNDSEGSDIDMYFRNEADGSRYWDGKSQYYIKLSSISGQGASIGFTTFTSDGNAVGGYRKFSSEAINATPDNWRKIAVYVNKSIGKVYVDQHRVAAVNQIVPGAGMVTFEFANDTYPIMIKNIRIAAGGTDAYNRVITDGRFIAYGILFDVNRATLKPESMGTINEIAKMMNEHRDLKFEIGGHTDSDGTAAVNNKLSQERADAVKQQLIRMGIDAVRLVAKGYGATKPITDNNNAENKARNRRVEFVKQ